MRGLHVGLNFTIFLLLLLLLTTGGDFTEDYSKLSGIIIPGFASTQLRAWSILDCPYSPLDFNPLDLVWLDTTKLLSAVNCWLKCMMLDPYNQTDHPECKSRPDSGLSAITELDPGYITGPLSSVWKEWVKWCIEFGIEANAILAVPYDWRLSPSKLEERDLYFHKLKLTFETALKLRGGPSIVFAHSMGNNVFRYFLEWLKLEIAPKQYIKWLDDHIHAYFAVGAPLLGATETVKATLSGFTSGAHTLSGNVFEARALDELLPQWKQEDAPIHVPVSSDKFWLLTENHALSLPSPFNNKGNYVISLSQLVRWLGLKAEELGVEIYPGFAASEILYDEDDKVIGVATNDMGVAKDGTRKDNFQRGVELKGQLTLLAEGCRGSLSEKLIQKYNLRNRGQGQHQTYALGIKEVWDISGEKHDPGSVIHTLGWPLDHKTYGGSFLYHMANRQVAVGFVVALNYQNPFLNPYEEFQKFKKHPAIRHLLEGGTVSQYGARTLNEGGYQSIPYPVFPGGAIIGCSAGFLNVPKIKGTHTAMKSGMLAAESAFSMLHEGFLMEAYWENLRSSWIWQELYAARNFRPAFEFGLFPGLVLSAFEHYIMKGSSPWTLKHGKPDHEATKEARLCSPIEYPKPDGVLSFDLPTSLYRSNTNHDHDQPAHLRLRDPRIPELLNLPSYAGPESRYCPARVYEYIPDEKGQLKLHINAQNCLHCKACDIKDPTQNIEWTVPEGGGGPGYSIM